MMKKKKRNRIADLHFIDPPIAYLNWERATTMKRRKRKRMANPRATDFLLSSLYCKRMKTKKRTINLHSAKFSVINLMKKGILNL